MQITSLFNLTDIQFLYSGACIVGRFASPFFDGKYTLEMALRRAGAHFQCFCLSKPPLGITQDLLR